MKLKESGRQKLDAGRNPVSRRNMQSYILTYSRLTDREPFTALSCHQRGTLSFLIPAIAVTEGFRYTGHNDIEIHLRRWLISSYSG